MPFGIWRQFRLGLNELRYGILVGVMLRNSIIYIGWSRLFAACESVNNMPCTWFNRDRRITVIEAMQKKMTVISWDGIVTVITLLP